MAYETYRIPANFTDAGRLFGMFPIRNAVEAVILAVPAAACLFVSLPLDLTMKIVVTLVAAIPLGGFALIGINDDSLTAFLWNWMQWKRCRGVITYRGTPPREKKRRKKNRSEEPWI